MELAPGKRRRRRPRGCCFHINRLRGGKVSAAKEIRDPPAYAGLLPANKVDGMADVTLIRGDGIGPEVTGAMRRAMDSLDPGIEWDVQEAGAAAVERYGKPL